MYNNRTAILFISFVLLWVQLILAQPDLNTERLMHGIKVYADASKPYLYYYEPGDLLFAHDSEQKPDLKFIQMRYTGTRAAGDQGIKRFRSLVRFRVVMDAPTRDTLRTVKQRLASRNTRIELRPLPIRRIRAVLVYTPIYPDPDAEAEVTVLPEGYFDATDEAGYGDRDVFWQERNYTLRLDNFTSQALWDAFSQGKILLSVGYAFWADGIAPEVSELSFSGTPELVAEMQKRFSQLNDSTQVDSTGSEAKMTSHIVKASAFEITVDVQQWPDLLQKVDINERIPPGYAALDVYCFDFNNELRPDLYAKRVEIKAVGVGKDTVFMHLTFRYKHPDIYAQNVRFPYAVRLDQPFWYRIIEIDKDGELFQSDWIERASWTEIVDVTTPRDRLEKTVVSDTLETNN